MTRSGVDEAWDADAVRVDLRRASIVVMAIWVGAFSAGFAFFVWSAIAYPQDRTSRNASWAAAVLCLLAAVWMLSRRRVLLIRRGFVLDRRGLHYWLGDGTGLLEWERVAALAISYESPPKVPLSGGGLVRRTIKDRRGAALEIFPVDPELLDQTPTLQPYTRVWRAHGWAAPWPDVPASRWFIPLAPSPGLLRRVSGAAERFASHRWRGMYRRPWTGDVVSILRRARARVKADAQGRSGVHRLCDVGDEHHRPLGVEPAATPEQRAQRLADDEGHDEV